MYFSERHSRHILSYDRKWAFHFFFVKGCLIISYPVTNSMWVILDNGNLITSCPMTNRKWVTKLNILPKASFITYTLWLSESKQLHMFLKDGLITLYPMTNSMSVTLYILCKAVSSHLICNWHRWWVSFYTYLKSVSSYDQQPVSGIQWTLFLNNNHIMPCSMTNRKWETLHVFWKDSLITSYPMTNSMWVTRCIFLKGGFILHCPEQEVRFYLLS